MMNKLDAARGIIILPKLINQTKMQKHLVHNKMKIIRILTF